MAIRSLNGWKRRAFQNFSGGLNTRHSSLSIKPNEFTQLDNAIINQRGVLEKATGYQVDGDPFPNSTDSFARLLFNYKRGTTVDKLVVAAYDGGNSNTTYKVDIKATEGDGAYSYIGYTTGTATFTNGSATVTGSGTAWSTHLKAGDKIGPDSTGTFYEIQSVGGAGTITLTSNYATATLTGVAYTGRIVLHKDYTPAAITFNDNMIITNGSETPMTYNNSTLSLITSANAPKGKFIEAHKNRVFIASTSGGPSSLYWSAVNDETTWDAASFEPVFPKDGGNICAIRSFSDSLVVLKDNGKIYQIVGSFDQDDVGEWDFIRKIDVPDNMGTIAGRTAVVLADNKLYFLAKSGWYTLDGRMALEKISWNIDPTTDAISIQPGAAQNKTFSYDSYAQWLTGTLSGVRATTGGDLETLFDAFTITDAYKISGGIASVIDTSNVVHVAYILNSDRTKIIYSKWDADGVKSTETALTHTVGIEKLTMDVSSAGKVGIMFRETTQNISFVERVAGTWSSADTPLSSSWSEFAIKYKSTGTCCFSGLAHGGGANNMYFGDRSGSAFAVNLVYAGANSNASGAGFSMYLDASNDVHVAFIDNNGGADPIRYLNGPSGGAGSWTRTLIAATTPQWPAGNPNAYAVTAIGQNGLGDILVVFQDGTSIIERNVTTSTSRTLATSVGMLVGYSISSDKRVWEQLDSSGTETLKFDTSYTTGTAAFTNGSATVTGTGTQWSTWLAAGDIIKRSTHADSVYATILTVDSDTQITLTATYTGGTSSGTYIAKRVNTVTNPTTASADYIIYPNHPSLTTNGTVVASCLFGASAEEGLIRRFSPFSSWTSPEASDSTLSLWSTYDVTSNTTNGNTVLFQIALNSSSPVTTYNTITSGSTISTNAANVFVRTKYYVTLAAWSKSSIGAIVLNYVGAGVDAKQPVSVVYNNENYTACCSSGNTANNQIILCDIDKAFEIFTSAVSVMCVYKYQLYAGLSSRGRIVKLDTGYNQGGVAYTMTAIGKEDLLGSLELEKEAYAVYVLYEVKSSGTFTFSYRLDNSFSNTSAWKDTVIDQTQNGLYQVKIGDRFKSIQFKISNSGLDQMVGIVGFIVVYEYLNIR